jgi:putative endonuclease
MKKSEIGRIGEDIAAKYLVNRGYIILKRNNREKFGEIDIIARSVDKILAFIEVKAISLNETAILKPEDNFTQQKLRNVNRMAQFFAAAHPELIDDEKGWRVDLVTVEISQNGKYAIRHYENI